MKHPQGGLLVIAEAELTTKDVEDVLVLHHGVSLETPRRITCSCHLVPGVFTWLVMPEVSQGNISIPSTMQVQVPSAVLHTGGVLAPATWGRGVGARKEKNI